VYLHFRWMINLLNHNIKGKRAWDEKIGSNRVICDAKPTKYSDHSFVLEAEVGVLVT
jgi:hypothetical protein